MLVSCQSTAEFAKAIDSSVNWSTADLTSYYIPDYKPSERCFAQIKIEQTFNYLMNVFDVFLKYDA